MKSILQEIFSQTEQKSAKIMTHRPKNQEGKSILENNY